MQAEMDSGSIVGMRHLRVAQESKVEEVKRKLQEYVTSNQFLLYLPV